MRLVIWQDSTDLTNTMSGKQFKPSKAQISRQVKCELVLTPSRLKVWANTLQEAVNQYEKAFGTILNPEEIMSKQRDQSSKK